MNTSLQQMLKQLGEWNPWWNMQYKSKDQVLAIYNRCLHESYDSAYNRYMRAALKADTIEEQADIMIAFQNRNFKEEN